MDGETIGSDDNTTSLTPANIVKKNVVYTEASGNIAKYTVNKPQIDEDDELGIRFHDSGMFNFMIKGSDLGFGNWKRAFGYLHSL